MIKKNKINFETKNQPKKKTANQERPKNMKTNPMNKIVRFAAVIVTVTLMGAGTAVMAQSGAKGGATKLLGITSRATATAASTVATAAKPMNCKMCVDRTIAIPDTEPKGLGAKTLVAKGTPVKFISTHDCTACGTDWNVVGNGRAKALVPAHRCGACG